MVDMKTRVAVLGGGVGALVSAFELTELSASIDYDIHLYQMGWRLGGKCASSRNTSKRFRNEEHGLHVLGGFYHNTFHVLERVYQAWTDMGAPDARPLKEAFFDLEGATLMEQDKPIFGPARPWRKVTVDFLKVDGEPGRSPPELDISTIVTRFLEWARNASKGLFPLLNFETADSLGSQSTEDDYFDSAFVRLLTSYDQLNNQGWPPTDDFGFLLIADDLIRRYGAILAELTDGRPLPEEMAAETATQMLGLGGGIKGKPIDILVVLLEALVIARGIVADLVPLRGFDSINQEEAKAWMRRHGAPPIVLNSVFVEFGYHYAFSYLEGEPSQPNIAAGAAVRTFARMLLTYQGSFFRHFNGGIGEVLIKPFYDVLRHRGVSFHFFNQVIALQPDAEGTRIDRIVLRQQAVLKDGRKTYDPFVERNKVYAWPHEPLFDQITKAPGQSELPRNFEDPAEIATGEVYTELKVQADFDLIILGIPPAALGEICKPLTAVSPKWEKMLAVANSVPTIAAQLWSEKSTSELGWSSDAAISTGHVLPLSTWSDMSHHLEGEDPSDFKSLSLLCGPFSEVLKPSAGLIVNKWLADHMADILPNRPPKGPSRGGEELYVRINSLPSDLYTVSPAGSIEPRMRTDETGFANLLLTGDWVRNGSDLGWVEGAVMSARQCARAITGVQFPVYGESDFG